MKESGWALFFDRFFLRQGVQWQRGPAQAGWPYYSGTPGDHLSGQLLKLNY